MNGWSPMLDVLILLLPFAGGWLGWSARAEKAERDVKRAGEIGYIKGYTRGKSDERARYVRMRNF